MTRKLASILSNLSLMASAEISTDDSVFAPTSPTACSLDVKVSVAEAVTVFCSLKALMPVVLTDLARARVVSIDKNPATRGTEVVRATVMARGKCMLDDCGVGREIIQWNCF